VALAGWTHAEPAILLQFACCWAGIPGPFEVAQQLTPQLTISEVVTTLSLESLAPGVSPGSHLWPCQLDLQLGPQRIKASWGQFVTREVLRVLSERHIGINEKVPSPPGSWAAGETAVPTDRDKSVTSAEVMGRVTEVTAGHPGGLPGGGVARAASRSAAELSAQRGGGKTRVDVPAGHSASVTEVNREGTDEF
jgi:hypothetical protein